MSVVSCLHMKHRKSDAGDVGTLFMSPTNRSGEPLSENPIRMQGIYQIFDVVCSWLRGLVKNDEEPQVLEERWMLHASRNVDEAKRSASQLQSSSLAAVFGLGQVQVKQRVEMPLTQHPVNESLLNHDGRSPRDGVGGRDTQRARKPSSASAPNEVHVVPTVLDEVMNVEGPPLLTSTKGMALECNMGHYEAEPHRLQLENDYAYYRWDGNHSTDTQAVQTSQGWNHRYRGWSSRQITRSHPCLSEDQAYNHAITQPIRGRNAMGQRHHDWREHV